MRGQYPRLKVHGSGTGWTTKDALLVLHSVLCVQGLGLALGYGFNVTYVRYPG